MSAAPDDSLSAWLPSFRGADAAAPPPLLRPGDRVGPFIAGGLLGRGAAAEVYHATHAETGEAAALKILRRTDGTAAARFRREAALLAARPHPALPRPLGSGERDGRPWLAEEELEARPLPRGDRAVARFLLALCGAVGRLHELGFVHRDIKPSNILFRADGSPVLADLGLAKRRDGAAAPAAAETAAPGARSELSVVDGRAVAVGTPGWSAPEQFAGGAVTPAADVHALGVLADACFGGRPPRAWRAIVRRATSSLPAERYASAAALARAIRRRHLPAVGLVAAAFAVAIALVAAGLSRPLRSVPPSTPSTASTAPTFGESDSPLRPAPELGRALGLGEATDWRTDALLPWVVPAEMGGSVVQSSFEDGVATSRMAFRVRGPGRLSFSYWKDFYKGRFAIDLDGETVFGDTSRLHGSRDWFDAAVDVPAGPHEIVFGYTHGGTGYVDSFSGVRIRGLRLER